MLDPSRKIIQDIYEEKEYDEQKLRRHKLRALQAHRIENTPRKTARDSAGNVNDMSYVQTGRTEPGLVTQRRAREQTEHDKKERERLEQA